MRHMKLSVRPITLAFAALGCAVAFGAANRVLRLASSSAFSNAQAANLVLGQADFSGGNVNRGGGTARNSLFDPGTATPIGVLQEEAEAPAA